MATMVSAGKRKREDLEDQMERKQGNDFTWLYPWLVKLQKAEDEEEAKEKRLQEVREWIAKAKEDKGRR